MIQGVRYIGRYDWSYHWHHPADRDFDTKFQAYAEQAIGPVPPSDNSFESGKINIKRSGYFTVVDAGRWGLDFLRAFKQECENDPNPLVERTFKVEEQAFGAYVRLPHTEYELGRLILAPNTGPPEIQHLTDGP